MSQSVALVTGGTGAIGTAVCQLFADEGYTVVANCHPAEATRIQSEFTAANTTFVLVPFDVTDSDACNQAINTIEADIGPIAVLVNAAGITRDAKISTLTAQQWSDVIRTNLDSVFNVSQPVVARMTQRGYGRIINVSSVNGQRGQIGQTNYSAAKAGMTGFTRALAREVARDGITVNSVSPGYVQSPMIEAVPEKVRSKIIQQIPVGRFAEPIEIAKSIAFLANKDSGYITGTDLSVNGGFHMG